MLAQALGFLPWLAALPLRLRRLRARLLMTTPPIRCGIRPPMLPIAWSHIDALRTRVAEEVRAEMVANVLSVAVTEGEQVQPGQTLAILESMKMEIPVVPETGGVVRRVAVAVGDVVQEGDLLVSLD